MFIIYAVSLLTWTILTASAARLRVSSELNLTVACESDHEQGLAALLWVTAVDLRGPLSSSFGSASVRQSSPFASCGPEMRDLPLDKITNPFGPVKLCAIGKLAKGGSFFASEDGSVLVKRVDKYEARELVDWGKRALDDMPGYPGGCEGFRTTLLVETTLSFSSDGSTYIVMPNLTYSLGVASPDNWVVEAVYDAKPLPNLGKGLVQLFKDVTTGWGADLPRLGEWLGWDEVQSLILHDMEFLANRVVDFSLFVHVLRREAGDGRTPEMLGHNKGCIVEPGRSLLICFRVLDYMTPFSWVRRKESQAKVDKFHDYADKFLEAFACLSNVEKPECVKYKALADVTEALEVSKTMAKAVLVGTTAFRDSYTCTHETPSLEYIEYEGTLYDLDKVVQVVDVPSDQALVSKDVKWIVDPSKSSDWLQAIASPKVAYPVGEKFEAKMELAYAMSEGRDNGAHRMPRISLQSCVQTVKDFATESYFNKILKTDMLNVLWSDDSEHVIVVRGLPRFKIPYAPLTVNYSHYEHKQTASVGRLRNCFLKTEYMRCDPEKRNGIYFNYKQHFGVLEVLVMSAREHSDDMNVYVEALQTRESIRATEDVATHFKSSIPVARF